MQENTPPITIFMISVLSCELTVTPPDRFMRTSCRFLQKVGVIAVIWKKTIIFAGKYKNYLWISNEFHFFQWSACFY